MSNWRMAARVGAVLACVGGVVLVVAQPASAARRDVVNLRVAGSYSVGGSPGSLTITVTKRSEGCVRARTAFAVRLSGLHADQVRVETASDGDEDSVGVAQLGGGVVGTEPRALGGDALCRGRSMTARYRLTFLPGAPTGNATVVAEARTSRGELIGRATRSSEVVAGRHSPSPKPSASSSAPPSPTPEGDDAIQAAGAIATPVSPVAGTGDGGGWFGIGTAVMLVGLVLVGIGGALLFLIVRRMREPSDSYPVGYDVGEPPTQILPASGAATGILPPFSGAKRGRHRSARGRPD